MAILYVLPLAFFEQLKAIPSVLPSTEATLMHLDAAASLVVKTWQIFKSCLFKQLKAIPSVLPSTEATLMHLDAAA